MVVEELELGLMLQEQQELLTQAAVEVAVEMVQEVVQEMALLQLQVVDQELLDKVIMEADKLNLVMLAAVGSAAVL